MVESDLEKAINEIKKNAKILKDFKKDFDVNFAEDKEQDRASEREFQLNMLWLQLKYGIVFTVLTILFSASIAYLVAAISVNLNLDPPVDITSLAIALAVVIVLATVTCALVIFVGVKTDIDNLRKQKITPKKPFLTPQNSDIQPTAQSIHAIEGNKEAYTFFSGIFVAIMGSIFVSSMFESAKSVLSKDLPIVVIFWNIVFLFSSVTFWQWSKKFLKKIEIFKDLWLFDWASFACILVGLFVIVLAVLGFA
jgi:hypothetical protein